MTKTIIIYEGKLFASPRHLINHFRVNGINEDIDIKLLTQYVYKGITRIKGVDLTYKEWNLDNSDLKSLYRRIKSLTRTGKGFIMGVTTPIDYYENVIKPLQNFSVNDPVKEAVDKAIEEGIGTEKDFKELLKGAKK